jgi:KipI family sensor histidine kinase inhibitor
VAADYFVAMVGFTPGFAYLSGLDPSLATSRRKDPRPLTPPGSIHIGGAQAAIQCLAGPSGWHLLGRTPVRTFHPRRDPVFLIAPGDAVTFYAISASAFAALDREAERGEVVAELVAP